MEFFQNLVGLVTYDGKVILNDLYTELGQRTLYYRSFCEMQIKNGYDCLIIIEGNDLKVAKLLRIN